MPDHPLVTAVIPTRGRPELLSSAVRSALRQTWANLEVLVVVDGPDAPTEALLEQLGERRLRILVLAAPQGGASARNAGVRAARGEWIAFLDDDDEWMPEKIDRQMAVVRQSGAWFPVVSCRLIAESESGRRVLPKRIYQPGEPVGDYLFCRRGLADPGGLMQTSTLLASRDLLLAVPFREELTMHQDWDWVVRVAAHEGVSITMLAQPLTVWRVEDRRTTVGRGSDWQFSLGWVRSLKQLVSPRAFSSFVAVQCAWRAQQSHGGVAARLKLAGAFLLEGRPEWRSFAHLLFFGFIPERVRRALRDRLQGRGAREPGLVLVSSRRQAAAVLRKNTL